MFYLSYCLALVHIACYFKMFLHKERKHTEKPRMRALFAYLYLSTIAIAG